MDRLQAMSILVWAAESGSLSAAGREMNIPLATVSRNVAELEAHLGANLVVRSRKGLQLTDAGQSFLGAAKAILENLALAERAASGEFVSPTGELVVAAPIVFGRMHAIPVVTEFLAAYPEIDLHLVQSDRIAHLVDDNIDCALRIGELPDSTLTTLALGTVRRVICASPGYLKQSGVPKSPRDLAQHQCITSEVFGARERWAFQQGGKEIAVQVGSRLAVNTADAAIEAAVLNGGVTRALSYQVAQHLRSGALKIILQDMELPPWPVHLVFKPQPRLPLKLRAFIDFAGPRLKRRLKDANA